MTKTAQEKKKGRIARHLDAARQLRREPRSAVRWLRSAFLRLWQARGGGFYGLGYVIAFIILEAKLFTGQFLGSESVTQFVTNEVLEYVFRFSVLSFLNGLLALLWPAYLLAWVGAWGIAVLVGGYFAFERVARPLIENWFPELKEARENKERLRREKAQRKKRGDSIGR